MPTVHTAISTTVSPDKVRAALLDFSPDRPKTWPGITASQYQVITVGDTTADIREGTGRVWAKEHYDWSDPDTVRWTVTDSNFCAPGSYVSATISRRADGGSDIALEWSRTPASLVGRIATLVIVATKGRPVAASFRKGLAGLESRTS